MRLLTEIGNDGSRSVDCLLDITIIIDLGQSTLGTRVISSLDHDNMAFTFGAESLQSFSYDHRSRSFLVRQKAGAVSIFLIVYEALIKFFHGKRKRDFRPCFLPHQKTARTMILVGETLQGLCAESKGRVIVVETRNDTGAWHGLAKLDDDGDVKKAVHTS
jgi:hypothetical protein